METTIYSAPTKTAKTPSITVDEYIEVADKFHWATMRHFKLWFSGKETKRHRRTETVLARLAKNNRIRTHLYGKKLIYALKRKSQKVDDVGYGKVKHGLACTECLVRLYLGNQKGIVYPERAFAGLGVVPECGIKYVGKEHDTMLLLEYCTKSNFHYSGLIRGKIAAYQRHIGKIEEKFGVKAFVLFVCDVERRLVERKVGSLAAARHDGGSTPLLPWYFVDYETFLNVEIGRTLDAEIYIYADEQVYNLK